MIESVDDFRFLSFFLFILQATIRKTLGDFKRTHYDGWSGETGHQQRFTEAQLAVLQDLVIPPTYFA